uniref:Uncharacterized protein n=1 Tax=Pithovirus LCPAC102 TaxID=2506587 RepID=A0A481Z343_9VIRU|nr:MAG: hypothetical protein LCPAC102_00760 [Pithovirus LCPAC102]
MIHHIKDIKDMEHIVTECKFIKSKHCEKIKLKLLSLQQKGHFIKRNSEMSSLGHASYMDSNIKDKCKSYFNKVKHTNNLLWHNFKPVYINLIKKLESTMDIKCIYPTENDYINTTLDHNYSDLINIKTKSSKDFKLALPGFHIFHGDTWLGNGWPIASLHVDKQFDKIIFPSHLEFDKSKVFSFTILISSVSYSGLYIYDMTENDIKYPLSPLALSLRNEKRYKIKYKSKYMYIHDGLHFHMISEFNSKPDDNRITLQGHGIYCITTGCYWIYW